LGGAVALDARNRLGWGEAVGAMADRKDFFRQMAIQCQQLVEIAGNPEIKQRMLDMAAHYQAKADENKDAEQ
jgi:hypothetical protein